MPALDFEVVTVRLELTTLQYHTSFFTDAVNLLIVNPTNAMTVAGESCFSGRVAHFFSKREFRVVPGALNCVRIVKEKNFGLPKLSIDANERQQAIQVHARRALLALRLISHRLGGTSGATWTFLRGGGAGDFAGSGKRPRVFLAGAHLIPSGEIGVSGPMARFAASCRRRAGEIGPRTSSAVLIHQS